MNESAPEIPPQLRTHSINTVAQLLERSRRWVYYQMEAGLLRYVYVGKARRVPEVELQRFIADSQAGHEDECAS